VEVDRAPEPLAGRALRHRTSSRRGAGSRAPTAVVSAVGLLRVRSSPSPARPAPRRTRCSAATARRRARRPAGARRFRAIHRLEVDLPRSAQRLWISRRHIKVRSRICGSAKGGPAQSSQGGRRRAIACPMTLRCMRVHLSRRRTAGVELDTRTNSNPPSRSP